MTAKLDDFIRQPADGILFDLNRLEEVSMTFLDDPKWVNDFAVAQVIRRLVAEIDALRAGKPLNPLAEKYFTEPLDNVAPIGA